jgi:hypothetical protein
MAESKRLSVPSNPARMLRELAREQQPAPADQQAAPSGEETEAPKLTKLQERKKANNIVSQEESNTENNQESNKDRNLESQQGRNIPTFQGNNQETNLGNNIESQEVSPDPVAPAPAVVKASQRPATAQKAAISDRDIRLAKILEAAEEDEMIVVSVRVPRRLNDYLDQYVSRAPRKPSKQRYLKQDAMTEALAAFAVDHPMPSPEDLF